MSSIHVFVGVHAFVCADKRVRLHPYSAAELTPFLFFVIQLNVKVQVFSLSESLCQSVWSREVFEQQLLFSASQRLAQETRSRENDSLYKSLALWLALETLETSFTVFMTRCHRLTVHAAKQSKHSSISAEKSPMNIEQ